MEFVYVFNRTNLIVCNPYCLACVNGTSSGCNNCTSLSKFYGGKCFDECPDGTFLMSNNTCGKCMAPCSTCNNLLECVTCIPQTYLNIIDSTCVARGECPTNAYADDITQQCIQCDSSCDTCNGPSSQDCLACNTDLGFLEKKSDSAGVCQMKSCSQGQYLGNSTLTNGKECIPCRPECETCNSDNPELCTKCNQKYIAEPVPNTNLFECKLCESFRGLKSPQIPGAPCDGKKNIN